MFPVRKPGSRSQKGKPMRGAPSTVWWGEPLSWLTSARLPVNGEGQPDSAMRLRQFNLCLWIMDIPSEWRPIYVLYHAHSPPPPIYFGWGYDLIASGSIDDGLPDLYARVKQGHQLGRLARTDMPNVLSPVVYDWLTDCARCLLRHAAHRCVDSQTRGSKTMCAIYAATKLPVSISQLH